MTARAALSWVAIGMTFAAYVPYLRDTISGRCRPHVLSWGMWGLATGVAAALQLTHGGGWGAVVTVAAASTCFTVAIISARRGVWDVTRSDVAFITAAAGALALWLVADRPVWSVVLLCVVDLLSFAPTVRKSWADPASETVSVYVVGSLRLTLAVAALGEHTVVTVLYPVVWSLANGAFAVGLLARRRAVAGGPVAVVA